METFILIVLIALVLFVILKLTKSKKDIVDKQYPLPVVEIPVVPPVVAKPKIVFENTKINMVDFDYVVIDFEYADKRQYACQLGIVTIKNNQIVDSVDFLIQPPDNQYGIYETQIHGIDAEKSKNAPSFIELWDEIKPYFENQIIVCHNSGTDMAVLNKTCAYYNLQLPMFNLVDTINIFGKVKLNLLAESFGVQLTNHHDALSDAYALAEIFVLYKIGVQPQTITLPKTVKKNTDFSERKIQSDVLVKDLNVENKSNPFYDKIVVITGVFEQYARNDIAIKLKSLGADVNSTVSKKTHYILIGKDAGPSKIQKIDDLNNKGANIALLYENDLEAVFKDDFSNIPKNEKP